jgi:phage terminase small subunit
VAELDNQQHELFAQSYVAVCGNAAEAARQAGYSDEGGAAKVRGWELLARPDVAARVDELSSERFRLVQIEAADVLRELIRIAMSDVAAAFDPHTNTLKNIHDIPLELRRAISSVKTEELWEGKGKDRAQIGWTKEVKFWNKDRGLEMLARTLALFKDTLRLEGARGEDVDENTRAARVASLFELARQRMESGEDLV